MPRSEIKPGTMWSVNDRQIYDCDSASVLLLNLKTIFITWHVFAGCNAKYVTRCRAHQRRLVSLTKEFFTNFYHFFILHLFLEDMYCFQLWVSLCLCHSLFLFVCLFSTPADFIIVTFHHHKCLSLMVIVMLALLILLLVTTVTIAVEHDIWSLPSETMIAITSVVYETVSYIVVLLKWGLVIHPYVDRWQEDCGNLHYRLCRCNRQCCLENKH